MGRKRIGLQTSRLEYGYGVKIWQGAAASAESLDADLVVFPGRNLDAPHGYDYQYNRLFPLMSRDNLGALVLVSTLVANYVDAEAMSRFCSSFEPMPLVSIGMRIPRVPSVVVDNRSGLREAVAHLAKRHGARRIAFVKGPEGNWEAQERFAAYREELETQGLSFDEALVARGDFTAHSGRPAVEELLGRNAEVPDAFVFCNDEMAIEGMRLLAERGISVPRSTAVVGFDDILETSTQSTPVTTVRQPLYEMGWEAVRMACSLLDGEEAPETTVLPTSLVIRSSCGCLVHCVDEVRALERIVEEAPALRAADGDPDSAVMAALEDSRISGLLDTPGRMDRVRKVLRDLLELCLGGREAVADEEKGFLSRFGEVLDEELNVGANPSGWRYIVPLLAVAIEQTCQAEVDSRRLGSLVRSCMLVASESTMIWLNGRNYQSNNANRVLLDVQYNLLSIMRPQDLVDALKVQLPRLGIFTFFLSEFESGWFHGPRSAWDLPAESRYIGGLVDGDEPACPVREGAVYPSSLLLPPGLLGADKRRTLAAYPLFFREIHYGTVVYELSQAEGCIYENLTTQISSIIRGIALYHMKEEAEDRLRRAMTELEVFNTQLSSLSLTDELTGLFNRRGFMKLASQQLSLTRQMGKRALVIYGDVNGLKRINDSYGHEEGDYAIKTIAGILRKTFRSMDIVARMGGDEFTVFASNTNEKQISFFQERMGELLREANASSGKPYSLSIGLGSAECLPDSTLSLEDYLREADAKLYELKKRA